MNSQQSNQTITVQQNKQSFQGNEEAIPDEGTSLIDQNGNNEVSHKSHEYKRSYQLSGKTYTYVGPQHSQLDDLFDLLDEKKQVPSKYELINKLRDLVNKAEELCRLHCTFFNGLLTLTPYYIVVVLIFICIYLVQMAQSLTLLSDSQVKDSEIKSLIVERLPLFGAFFTLFAIIYIQIINSYIKIFLFIFGTLFPIAYMIVVYFNLLNLFSDSNYDYEMIILLSTISGSVLNGILVQSLYQWIKSFLHEIYSTIFASGWCILVAYFIGFYVISFILTINSITSVDLINYLLGKLYIPLLALLIFSWFILKARLFDWPDSVTETAISRLIEKLEKLYVKPDNSQISTKWLNKNQFKILSYSIGILYIVLEIYLFINLADIVSQQVIDYKAIITYSVIIVGIPIYLFAGILIAVNNRQPSRTFLLTPLIFGGPLIFALLKLGIEISLYEETVPIIDIIYYSPLVLLIIWLTLNLIGIEQRKIQLYTLAFICYFIALPIGVLYPLYQLTNNSVYLYFIYILMIIASCLLAYWIIQTIYKGFLEFRKIKTLASQDYPDFGEFSSYNLTNFAHWINSAFFLLTFFYLAEYFWYIQYDTDNQATDTEIGTIYGLMIIHPLIFILINVALSTESLEITSEFAEDNNMATQMETIKNKQKLEKNQFYNIIIAVLILLTFLIFYPLGYLQNNLQLGTLFFVLAFGVPGCLLLFKMLQIIKNKSALYENFFQPFTSIFFWCCVIFPLGLVVPILSVQFQNTSEEFQVFAQLAVAMGLFVCIMGVTGLSLFFSILLNKEEFERKKREVLKLVMLRLSENHVLNDLAVVSLLYIKYIQNLTKSFGQLKGIKQMNIRKLKETEIKELLQKKMIDDLIQGVPVNVIPYNGPQMTFDHKLVGKKQYDKLQEHLKESLVKDKQKGQHYCFRLLADCLCCRCGLEEMNQLNNQRDQEIITLRLLLRIDENHDEIISHLLPGFKDVQRLDGQPNPMLQLELDPQARILNKKQQFKPIEEIYSSKTEDLMQIQKKELTEKAVSKSKTTDYFKSLALNDVMIAEFMHEVFMEFSNQDQDLPPTICYNDFVQFCRLSEIKFTLLDYKRFAKQPWINQTNSMSEIDFANLMKSLSKPEQDPFENLKSLILDKIYPNLILNIKTLMYNLKSNNRQVLKNTVDQNTSPFLRTNFNSDYVFYEKTQQQKIKQRNEDLKKININQNVNNNSNISKEPVKSKIQRKLEFEQQQQLIREEYLNKLPSYKRCCYQCCGFFNRMCCQKILDSFQNMFGAFSNTKKEESIVIDVFGQRQMMPPWKMVCKIVIDTLFQASDEYDQKYRDIQNQGFAFRISQSNILGLIFRFQDLYGLAALAFNSQVGWFGETQTQTQTQTQYVSMSVVSNYFEISFWLSVGLTITYGFLGIFAADRVQKNTFGLDEAGNVAAMPHPQYFLTKSIQTSSGQFLIIMTAFIDSFVCDYNSFPYTMAKLDSVECLSNYHFMYMGIALVCAAIYYPLSTFLQPTFQFSDHSLDLKYKSSYLIVYIQCKLLILGLSSIFSNFDTAFIYQLSFSTIILLFLIILYMRMEPCYVKWFNVIELIIFLMILSIYVGAIIIMLFQNYLVGLIFSIVFLSLLFIFMIVYIVRNILGWRGRAQILVSDAKDQIKLSQKKEKVDLNKLIEDDLNNQMNEHQNIRKPKQQIIQPFEGSPLSFNQQSQGNNDLSEMKNIKGQIHLEQVDVQKDQYIHKKKF